MIFEQAANPRGLGETSSQSKHIVLTQSRETGDVLLPKQPDGAPVATGAPVAKAWAHFVAGG